MTPILLDTAPGIDDTMAIFYAMADPEIELVGMTTVFGNVYTPDGTRTALALCEVAGQSFASREWSDALLIEADLVVITTDHSAFDYDQVVALSQRVIDTRNATKDVSDGRDKIRLLGGGGR